MCSRLLLQHIAEHILLELLKLVHTVTIAGGKEHPMDLYVAFRGHKPQTKALIDQMGLKK